MNPSFLGLIDMHLGLHVACLRVYTKFKVRKCMGQGRTLVHMRLCVFTNAYKRVNECMLELFFFVFR